jgi:DNA (cytosine-5)-methyltransferase 1
VTELVLSIFPGIDLLGRAFTEEGFCVVTGPDLISGGDIRDFSVPEGHFSGVIGGPPCQDFSKLRREPPTGYGLEMLAEYERIVNEAQPEWFLLENVPGCPNVTVRGYTHQRIDVNLSWYCDGSRLRHIQFGSRVGDLIHVDKFVTRQASHGAALANDDRSFEELCRIQCLPQGFDLPGMTVKGKKRAVGNGVPLPMGRVLAEAVTHRSQKDAHRRCACGCGRIVTGRRKYCDCAGRKRAQRKRDAAAPKCDRAPQQ